MGEPEHEIRDRLSQTWKALMGRLAEYDFPPQIVFETLAEVATDGMLREFGPSAAAHMLRLRADAIEAEELGRIHELFSGADRELDAATMPIVASVSFDQIRIVANDSDLVLDIVGR